MNKITEINIGGRKEPLFCDLSVLERLQDEFGSLNSFEKALIGLKEETDAEGNVVNTYIVEPSMKAINVALVEMINEGRAIRAYEQGKTWEAVDDIEILSICTVPFQILAPIIHQEYKRCFETKKPIAEGRKREKRQK